SRHAARAEAVRGQCGPRDGAATSHSASRPHHRRPQEQTAWARQTRGPAPAPEEHRRCCGAPGEGAAAQPGFADVLLARLLRRHSEEAEHAVGAALRLGYAGPPVEEVLRRSQDVAVEMLRNARVHVQDLLSRERRRRIEDGERASRETYAKL